MSFTPNELKAYIQEQLNTVPMIPTGHKAAFIVHYDDSGARAVVAIKTNHDWVVDGYIGYTAVTHGLDYGLNVMKTW